MIVKLLGILDIAVAIIFFLNNSWDKVCGGWLPDNIVFYAGIYLLIKGLMFVWSMDFASMVDIFCGVVILFSLIFQIPLAFASIVILFIVIKGCLSLIT
jgi:hypothetical protein